jgi:2'-5' RNA ligase
MNSEPHQDIYFIGIRLSPDLERQISRLQWQLYGLDEAMQRPLVPHITLLNPPSLTGIMPDELLPQVRKVAKRYLPLTIALQSIDFFGNTICYVAVQSHQIDSLQAQLVAALPPKAQELHYRRPYRPHITLAQIYEPGVLDKRRVREVIDSHLALPRQFQVETVSYFKRILPREYRAEEI